MRLPDGREAIARLELPLPMTVTGELMRAIAECAERLGYTDVVISTEGGHRIIATPPGWTPPAETRHEIPEHQRELAQAPDVRPKNPQGGPAAPEEGAPTAPAP